MTAAAPPRGPGRPSTGVRVDIRIPADLLEAIDQHARRWEIKRAAAIRFMLEFAVEDGPEWSGD